MRFIALLSALRGARDIGPGSHRRMEMRSVVCLSVLVSVGFALPSLGAVQSTFDTDQDGWTKGAGDVGSELFYLPMEGNPGGHLWYRDVGGNMLDYVLAPPKFLGDKSAFYGGAISFDMKLSLVNPRPLWAVILTDGTSILSSTDITPTTTFTTYTFPLAPGSWRFYSDGPFATDAQILSVLSNLTQILITVDYDRDNAELVSIDNVFLVPEPGAAVFIAPAVVMLRRKRQ